MKKNTKAVMLCSSFLLAGCQFTVGQAILTSVGSKNTSSTVEGHIVSANSEHKTSKESIAKEPASNSVAVPSSPTSSPVPTVTPSPGPSSTVIIATNPTPSPSVTPTVSSSPAKQ